MHDQLRDTVVAVFYRIKFIALEFAHLLVADNQCMIQQRLSYI